MSLTDPLAKARATLAARREAGTLEQRDPIQRSIDEPGSLKAAINATCWECVGRGGDDNPRREVTLCTAWGCPLWKLRPWQHNAPEGFGLAERAAAEAAYPDNPRSPFASLLKRPESRRRAINGKCAECMGGSPSLIADCPAEFPREHRGGNYRGCPLWPHRPNKPHPGPAQLS